jgi:hypothetical protein
MENRDFKHDIKIVRKNQRKTLYIDFASGQKLGWWFGGF